MSSFKVGCNEPSASHLIPFWVLLSRGDNFIAFQGETTLSRSIESFDLQIYYSTKVT